MEDIIKQCSFFLLNNRKKMTDCTFNSPYSPPWACLTLQSQGILRKLAYTFCWNHLISYQGMCGGQIVQIITSAKSTL